MSRGSGICYIERNTSVNGLELKNQVNKLIAGGDYDAVKPLLLSYKDITEHDNDLAMTCYLCTIHEQEKAAGQESVFAKVGGMDELLERYTVLKFYLRRIDFDVADDIEPFYQFLSEQKIFLMRYLGPLTLVLYTRTKSYGM